ncbi:MAG: hypothetical protein IJ679_05335 [Lachnospiraceae bacterium]|nr:hypothetical protein [Lachnospiraceae bacterium]
MRLAIELILLSLGAVTAAYSFEHRILPRGVVEWMVWIADIAIIFLRVAGM